MMKYVVKGVNKRGTHSVSLWRRSRVGDLLTCGIGFHLAKRGFMGGFVLQPFFDYHDRTWTFVLDVRWLRY